MEFALIVLGVVTVWFAVLGVAAGWSAMVARSREDDDGELARGVLGAVKLVTLVGAVPGLGALLWWESSTTSRDHFGTISFVTVVGGGFFLLLSYIAAIVLGTVGCAIVKRMPAMMAAGVMFATFVALPALSLASTATQYAVQRAKR